MSSIPPVVSVLLPFNQADAYLEIAIRSIVEQSYTNLEILLLDNCAKKAKSQFAHSDSRVKIVDCRGLGTLSEVLNAGIKVASGKYLARMDADDISEPKRIEAQVGFMESNSSVGILGTAITVIDELGSPIEVKFQPSTHAELIKKLPANNPFFHSTVMIRKSAIAKMNGPYSKCFVRAQDYELWTRLLIVTQGANISDTLVAYRSHENQIGRRIPHSSIFYYRLAQGKFHIKQVFNRGLGIRWRDLLYVLRLLVLDSIRYGYWLIYQHLTSFKRRR
jgi:glycosyltransferase involved in cell wall biosynthesis